MVDHSSSCGFDFYLELSICLLKKKVSESKWKNMTSLEVEP